MNRKNIIFLAVSMIVQLFGVFLHGAEEPNLKVIKCSVDKIDGMLNITISLNGKDLFIASNEELEVYPFLAGLKDTLQLSPVIFTGMNRDKVNHRAFRLYGSPTSVESFNVKRLKEMENSTVLYRKSVPFEEWMYGSKLMLGMVINGCADCSKKLPEKTLYCLPEKLQVNYIVPEPELKRREKKEDLYLSFHQGKSNILSEYGNNGVELAKADKLMEEILNDIVIVPVAIVVTGYASPEGKYDYNTRLSVARAEALKNYLMDKYSPEEKLFVTKGLSEDWNGLYRIIQGSDNVYKDKILTIIDQTEKPDDRDIKIRKLDNGKTYGELLQNIYPSLRRVECVVDYSIVPFNVEQSKERLKTHPEQVSLNEMYLVAQSYPVRSDDFNRIFYKMLYLYPKNVAANNNMAAIALEAGDMNLARNCLEMIKTSPLAQNNLGIFYYLEGNIPQAKYCFEKACECGCKEAEYNLKEINKLLTTDN